MPFERQFFSYQFWVSILVSGLTKSFEEFGFDLVMIDSFNSNAHMHIADVN